MKKIISLITIIFCFLYSYSDDPVILPDGTKIDSVNNSYLDSIYLEINPTSTKHWYEDGTWKYKEVTSVLDLLDFDGTSAHIGISKSGSIIDGTDYKDDVLIMKIYEHYNLNYVSKFFQQFQSVFNINLNNKQIDSISTELKDLGDKTSIFLDNNSLNYDQVEQINSMGIRKINALNQDSIGELDTLRVFYGDSLKIHTGEVGGDMSKLKFTWHLNDNSLKKTIKADSNFSFVFRFPKDTGSYWANVEHDDFKSSASIPAYGKVILQDKPSPHYDSIGLKALYDSLHINKLFALPQWPVEAVTYDHSNTTEWPGVFTESHPTINDKSVIDSINLSNQNLKGTIPYDIRYIGKLRHLDLSRNNITRTYEALNYLPNIDSLKLEKNKLTFYELEKLIYTNKRIGTAFSYHNQDTIFNGHITYFDIDNVAHEISKGVDSTVVLTRFPSILHLNPASKAKYNKYKWFWKFKDATSFTDISGSYSSSDTQLVNFLDEISPLSYQVDTILNIYAEVINDSLSGLTLYSDTFNIHTKRSLYTDSLYLVDFYHAAKGDGWLNKWDFKGKIFTWFGVNFNATKDRVTEIILEGNKLDSVISNSIIFMDSLTTLNLSNNELDSATPNLLKTPSIDTIDISRNEFTFSSLELIKDIHNYIDEDKNELIKYNNQKYQVQDSIEYHFEGKLLKEKAYNSTVEAKTVDYLDLIKIDLDNIRLGADSVSVIKSLKLRYKDTAVYDTAEIKNPVLYSKQLNYDDNGMNILFRYFYSHKQFPNLTYADSSYLIAQGNAYLDSLALMQIYNTTKGAQWTWPTGCVKWPNGTLIDLANNRWCGITTATRTKTVPRRYTSSRVIRINLHNFNVSGAIPPQIGFFDWVTNLKLDSNNITSIPPEVRGVGDTRAYSGVVYNPTDFYLDSVDIRYNRLNYQSVENILSHGEFNSPTDYVTKKLIYDDDGDNINDYLLISPQKPAFIHYRKHFGDEKDTTYVDTTITIQSYSKFDIGYDQTSASSSLKLYKKDKDGNTLFETNSAEIKDENFYTKDTTFYIAIEEADPLSIANYTNGRYSFLYTDSKTEDTLRLKSGEIAVAFQGNRYSDSIVLISIKNSLGITDTDWPTGSSIDSWKYIGINSSSRIDSINLSDLGIDNSKFIPSEISLLDSLRYFSIGNSDNDPSNDNAINQIKKADLDYIYANPFDSIRIDYFNNLDSFIISNNKFKYSDLEDLIGFKRFSKTSGVYYSPQNIRPKLQLTNIAGRPDIKDNDTTTVLPIFSKPSISIQPSAETNFSHSATTYQFYNDSTKMAIPFNLSFFSVGDYEILNSDTLEFYMVTSNSDFPLLKFYTDTLIGAGKTNRISDSLALIRILDATYPNNAWDPKVKWINEADRIGTNLEDWYGITTSKAKTGRVDSIILQNVGIKGEIPQYLASIDSVRYIALDTNLIDDFSTGAENIMDSKNFDYLSISHNNLFYNDLNKFYNNLKNKNISNFRDTILYYPQDILPIETVYSQNLKNKINNVDDPKKINSAFAFDSIHFEIEANGADHANLYMGNSFVGNDDYNSVFNIGKRIVYMEDTIKFHYKLNSDTYTDLVYSDTIRILQTGSRYTDSLFLVDLYNSTKGPLWNDNFFWLTNQPIDVWTGVGMKNNRLNSLKLPNNQLDSLLPKTIYYLDSIKTLDLSDNNLDTISTDGYLKSNQLNFNFSNNKIDSITKTFFKTDSSWSTASSLDGNYLNFNVLELLGTRIIDSLSYKNQKIFKTNYDENQLVRIKYKDSAKIIMNIPDKAEHNSITWQIWKTTNTTPDSITVDSNELAPIYRDSAVMFVMDSLWQIENVQFLRDTFKLIALIKNDSVKLSKTEAISGYTSKPDNFYKFHVANILLEKDLQTDSIALLVMKDSVENETNLSSWDASTTIKGNWKGLFLNKKESRIDSINLNAENFSDIVQVKGNMPKIVGEIDSLKYLFLKGNLIDTIPNELSGLINLKEIDLSNNGLNSIKIEAWKFKQLDSLLVRNNNLGFADLLTLKDSMTLHAPPSFDIVKYEGQTYDFKDTIVDDSLRRGFIYDLTAKLVDKESKYTATASYPDGKSAWTINYTKANDFDTIIDKHYWNYPDDTLKIEIFAKHDQLPLLELNTRQHYIFDYQGSKKQDTASLRAIQRALDPSLTNLTWNINSDLSFYPGIETKTIHGEERVVKIDLTNKNLSGNIPDQIMDLVKLETLIVRNNKISSFSDSIKYLYPKLKYVDITNNEFKTLTDRFAWTDSLKVFKADSNNIDIASTINAIDSIYKLSDTLRLRYNNYNYTDLSTLYRSFEDLDASKNDTLIWMPQDTLGIIDTLQGDYRLITMTTDFGKTSEGTTVIDWKHKNIPSASLINKGNNNEEYKLKYTHLDSGWYYIEAKNYKLGTLIHHHKRVIHPPKIFGGAYYEAFKDIYNTTKGNEWSPEYRWNPNDTIYSNFDPSKFKGIEIIYGRVVRIKLDSANLQGTISESFNKLYDIDTLVLSNNKLNSIHNDALLGYDSLRILDLNFSSTSTLPNLEEAPELTYLNANYGNLSDISNANIDKLKNLENIELNNNSITSIPNLGASSSKLINIDFSYNTINNITSISTNSFPKVENFNVGANDISGNIGSINMPNLATLNISNNSISSYSLVGATRPTHVAVYNNELTSIPTYLDLKIVEAYNNNISSVIIDNGSNIEIINLAWNKLKTVSLNDLPKLRGLILNNNEITNLNLGSSFNKNKNLEKVNLHNNNLKEIDSKISIANYASLQNNFLTFNDLMPFRNNKANISYAPQKIIGKVDTLTLDSGQVASINVDASINSEKNKYQWYYYETLINEEKYDNDNRDFTFNPSYNPHTHKGIYYYKVTNSEFPDLTLESAFTFVKTKNSNSNSDKNSKKAENTNKDLVIEKFGPNPFKSTSTIYYKLNKNTQLNIVLYNSAGNAMKTLFSDFSVSGNFYQEIDAELLNLNYGVYFVVFTTQTERNILKITYLK